jgi:hypothetical protein
MRGQRAGVFSGSKERQAERGHIWQAVRSRLKLPDGLRSSNGRAQSDTQSSSGGRPKSTKARADKGDTPGNALLVQMFAGDAAQEAWGFEGRKRQWFTAI